jgi:hypothetical protein
VTTKTGSAAGGPSATSVATHRATRHPADEGHAPAHPKDILRLSQSLSGPDHGPMNTTSLNLPPLQERRTTRPGTTLLLPDTQSLPLPRDRQSTPGPHPLTMVDLHEVLPLGRLSLQTPTAQDPVTLQNVLNHHPRQRERSTRSLLSPQGHGR